MKRGRKPQGWQQGKPPKIGWYWASIARADNIVRWWNGEKWSWPLMTDQTYTTFTIDYMAKQVTSDGSQSLIEWRYIL